MIKFSFSVPAWMLWLIPDHEKIEARAAVTGRASRSYLFGIITIEAKHQA